MPSPAPYLNFDLLITRAGDRYRALVVDAPGGDADIFFDLPPSLPGFQDLLALTGPRRGLHEEPAQTIPAASLDDVGRLLYDAIFQGEVRDVLVASQREAANNAGLRLRLRFHEDAAELATLPWELLYDAGQERFLALSETLPILRYMSLPRPRPALVTKPPLRILAVLASPDGLDALDLEAEWQVLAEALAPLANDGKVVLERLAAPTPSALQGRLLGDPVHVLHFVGHGVFDEESKQGMLVLSDEQNQPKLMGAQELATLLATHTFLRLLYLNACEGALGDNANVFAGLAQRLVQGGAPAAIAMQAEISDSASIDLARTFYTALATGRPVDAALTQARVTLAMNSSREWATPVLFSRAPDNRLFDIRAVLPTPDCPYPGMRPFTEEQANLFFGREKEVDEAVNRLAQHPFLTVIGPSGSGKSSLIYAGILPALRASRRFGKGQWTIHTMRPSDARTPDGKAAPMQTLSRLISHQSSVISDGAAPAFRHQLSEPDRQSPVTSHQSPVTNPQSPVPDPQSPVLLFIDQFEEIFTLADAAEAAEFLKVMHQLIGTPNLYILLTVRADFYPKIMAAGPIWETIKANRLELTPLGDDGLWAAIVEPAAQVGVSVDDALAVALIADAASAVGALPLVQETLVLLWEKVEARQLKRDAYRQMAEGNRTGIQVAIDRRANVVYNNLPDAAKPIARRIFLRLIQFGVGHVDTRRQQSVTELHASGDDPVRFDETLRTLVDSRLLTSSGEEASAERRVDISHEALIGGWALLQKWIGEKREAESTRRRLEEKAAEWVRLETGGGLLDDYEVQEAEAWLKSDYSEDLGYSQNLLDLIAASEVALARTKVEKAEAERTRQRSRIFAGGLVLAVLVIALVSYFAFTAQSARNEAEIARSDAEIAATAEATAHLQAIAEAQRAAVARATAEASEVEAIAAKSEAERLARRLLSIQLALRSDAERLLYPQRSLLLAVEAVQVTQERGEPPVLEAETALRSSLQAMQGSVALTQFEGNVCTLAVSPDRSRLALSDCDNGQTAAIWDLTAPEVAPLALFSSDNQTFSPGTGTEGARAAAQEDPFQVLEGSGLFNPDGRWFLMPDYRRTQDPEAGTSFLLWDVDARVGPFVLSSPPGFYAEPLFGQNAAAAAFSHKGALLAVGGVGGQIALWDLQDLGRMAQILQLADLPGQVLTLAFSPDDIWLALAAQDIPWSRGETVTHSVYFLSFDPSHASILPMRLADNASTGERALTIPYFRFDPTSKKLFTATDLGVVQIWDLEQDPPASTLLWQADTPITRLELDNTGNWLFAVASHPGGSALRLWQVDGVEAVALTLPPLQGQVAAAVFHPDNQRLAYSDEANTYLVDLSGDSQEPSVQPVLHSAGALHFSQDGSRLVGSVHDNLIAVWSRAEDGDFERTHLLSGQEHYSPYLAIDPSGERIAAISDTSPTSRLWELSRLHLSDPQISLGQVDAMAVSPDERLLLAVQGRQLVAWDLLDPQIPPARKVLLEGLDFREARALTISLDQDRLAIGDHGGQIGLWQLDRQKLTISGEMQRLQIDSPVYSLRFDREGRRLFAATYYSPDSPITVWDLAEEAAPSIVFEGKRGPVLKLDISPDGRWLAAHMLDDQLNLWQLYPDTVLPQAVAGEPFLFYAKDFAFSPHSNQLAVGGDRAIELYDLDTLSATSDPSHELPPAAILANDERGPMRVAFSPNGRFLYGLVDETRLTRWEIDGDEEKRLDIPVKNAAFHWLYAAGNFHWVVAAGFDGPYELWRMDADGIVSTSRYIAAICCGRPLAVSPDGRWLVTLDHGGTYRVSQGALYLWRLDIDAMVTLACERSGRNFNESEWSMVYGDMPYRKTCLA